MFRKIKQVKGMRSDQRSWWKSIVSSGEPSEVANIFSNTSYRIDRRTVPDKLPTAHLDRFVPTARYNNRVQNVRAESYTGYPNMDTLKSIGVK